MELKNPKIAYTAASNVEAHMIVELLLSNGIPAHAVEDQSGVSMWSFGTISQFHQPNVWVDETSLEQAEELIRDYEEKRRQRERPRETGGEIETVCEDCGKVTSFPDSLDGTTQECSQCGAYVDVGELPWDDDFGEAEDA